MADIKKKKLWQVQQDGLAQAFGISIHLFDERGLEYLPPSFPCSFCKRTKKIDSIKLICEGYISLVSNKTNKMNEIFIDKCPFGISSFIYKFRDANMKHYTLFAGQFFIESSSTSPYDNLQIQVLEDVSHNNHKQLQELIDALELIPVYTNLEVQSKSKFLADLFRDMASEVFSKDRYINKKMAGDRMLNSIDIVEEVIEKININLHQLYKLDMLLEGLPITKRTFFRHFLKHTGKNFQDYCEERKINEMKRLLRDTTLTVAEISKKIGYLDSQYLSKKFKKVVGFSPTEYRQRHYCD